MKWLLLFVAVVVMLADATLIAVVDFDFVILTELLFCLLNDEDLLLF